MARLIHLNGPPGIGKSTIARRYVEEHPWTLNLDIDQLRTFIGGWRDDFERAGELIRPAAIALMVAYLGQGQDVVMPQMLMAAAELEKFEAAAHTAGADFVEIFLMDDRESAVARFRDRGSGGSASSWHEQVRDIVADNGGDATLRTCHDRLVALAGARPRAIVVDSVASEIEETLAAVCSVIGN